MFLAPAPELRLVTPTDPEAAEPDDEALPDKGEPFYQLTHDYLVPALREWLTRKQKETRRGRAELRLADRAALWHSKPENRHLPSLLEWANIRTFTNKSTWSEPQRKTWDASMHAADRSKDAVGSTRPNAELVLAPANRNSADARR